MVTIYRTMDVSTGKVYPTQGVDPSITGGTVSDNRSVDIVFQYLRGRTDVTEEWVSTHYSYITFDVATDDGTPYTYHNNSSTPFNGRSFGVPSEVVRRVSSTYLKFQLAFLDTSLDIDYNDPIIALSTVYSERLDSSRLARSSIDRLLVRDSITDPGTTDGWMTEAWKDFFSNNAVLTIDIGSGSGEAQRTLTIKTKTGPVRTVRLPVLTFDEAEPRGEAPIETFLRSENACVTSYFTTSAMRRILRDVMATRQGRVAYDRTLPEGRTEWEVGDISLDTSEGSVPGETMPAAASTVSALSAKLDAYITATDTALATLTQSVNSLTAALGVETGNRITGDTNAATAQSTVNSGFTQSIAALTQRVDKALEYYTARATRNSYRPNDIKTATLTAGQTEVTLTFPSQVIGIYEVRLGENLIYPQWFLVADSDNKKVRFAGLDGLTGTLTVKAMCMVV